MADFLDRFSNRTFRVAGIAIILIGVPTVIATWSDQGAVFASVVAFGHLYLGAFIAFGLPWLRQRRQAQSRSL